MEQNGHEPLENAAPALNAETEPNPENVVDTAPESDVTATPAAEAGDAPATEAAAPAPAPAKKKGPPRPPGSGAFETEMGLVLAQLYADYDFDVVEDAAPAGRILALWALPDDKKVPAPAAPANKTKTASFKEKWAPRIDLASRKPDYRLYAFLSKTKDPGWSVPGKDILAMCTDKTSTYGLLLLMADQRGFFLPTHRVKDLCELFTPVAASPFKITGPKLRKAAIARFFSLAGFARELAAARQS
ncbi:MAG: hypothetical protein HY925_02190 [Elusimicrobia bacterium]|nr:hypothetical protein [Elusimicrobiota bacterium]